MKNTVTLLGWYGSDEVHAASGWTSTSRELSKEKINRVPTFLEMLASHGHHTPFEKSSLHFLVTVDQATHIHLLKHRIGVSINAESARYKELKEDKMYIPKDWKGTPIEQSVYFDYAGAAYEAASCDWTTILTDYTELGNKLYHQCLTELTTVLGRKRAKESARFFKTINSQISMDVMFNWRSFYNFQKLRNDEHSQKEVREVAQQMLELVKDIEGNPFKHTIDAFKL